MGGNFWQGAAIGLTVSALNHVAHSFSKLLFERKIDNSLKNAELNPDEKPIYNNPEDIKSFIEKIDVLKSLLEKTGKRFRVFFGDELDDNYRRYNGYKKSIYINRINKSGLNFDPAKGLDGGIINNRSINLFDNSFNSNRSLALTIGYGLKYFSIVTITHPGIIKTKDKYDANKKAFNWYYEWGY